MEEEAIKDAHELFVKTGYKGDIEAYKNLISTNPNALKDSHELFVKTGYKKDLNSFSELLGVTPVKKKDGSTPTSVGKKSESVQENGSSGSPKFSLAGEKTKIPENKKDLAADLYGDVQQNDNANYKTKTTYINKATGKQSRGLLGDTVDSKRAREKELTKNYNEVTALTEDDNNEIANRLQSEESGPSLLDRTAKGIGSVLNETVVKPLNMVMTAFGKTTIDDINNNKGIIPLIEDKVRSPFEEQIKDVKKQAYKNREKLTEAETIQRAKDLFVEKEKLNIHVDKANSYLDNLSQEDKKILELDRYDDITNLGEKNKKSLNALSILKANFQNKNEEFLDVKNEIETLAKENKEIPSELLERGVKLESELKSNSDVANVIYDSLVKNQEDLGTAEQEFDLFKRENRDWANISKNIGVVSGEIGTGLLSFQQWYGSMIGKISGKENNQGFQESFAKGNENIAELNSKLEAAREKLRKPVDSIESAEGFVNYATDLLANQAPILAMTATGYGGLAFLGASTTGQKYGKMNQEVLEGKANYSPLEMAVVPLLYGSSEVVSEIPTMGILKKAGRVFSATGSDLIIKSAKEKAVDFAKDYGIDMTKELAGEEFTQFTQNFTDKYILGKDDVGLLDNTGKVFKDTFTLTSILKVSPHIAGAIVKPFQTKNELVQLDENSRKMIEFSKQLESDNLSETEKIVIKKQIEKLNASSSSIMAKTIDKIGTIPDELYEEIKFLNKKAGEVKAQAKEIQLDSNLQNKDELIQSLEEEYKLIQAKRQAVINGTTSVVEVLPLQEQEKLKRQAMEDLVNELNPDGSKDMEITDKQVLDRANEIYADSKKNETEVNLPLGNSQNQQNDSKAEVNLPQTENTTTQTSTPTSLEEATPSVQSNNSTNEEVQTTTTETQQEAQPQAEEQKAGQEDLSQIEKDRKIALETLVFENGNFRPANEKEIDEINTKYDAELKALENEGTATNDTSVNGNVSVGNNVMEQNGTPEQQSNLSEGLQSANDIANSQTENTVKPISVGNFNYTFSNGTWNATDKDGNAKPKPAKKGKLVPEKVLEKHAETFDFTQGETAYDKRAIQDVSTWEEDVAKYSDNPVEIAENLLQLKVSDATEGLDTTSKAIAEVIGGKSVERSSYVRWGDRNNINASIALQYFAKKGKGFGIDQIAMMAEESIYGDYDAQNPRITTDDVIDFINDNPRGAVDYLNRPKKEKEDALKTAFTDITGLPANDKYLNIAIQKAKEKTEYLNNASTIDLLSDEDLLSLQSEIEQFEKETYGTIEKNNEIDANGKGISESESISTNEQRSRVQEESGANGEQETVASEPITNDSTSDQMLNWLDNLEKNLDNFNNENLSALVPIPIAVAKIAIQAMRVAIQAGKVASDVIQSGIDALKQTQWWQGLTSAEQKDVESDFINNISGGDRKTANALNRAISDTVTEEEAYDQFRDTAEKSRTELQNKKPTKDFFREQYRKFVRRFTDRQYLAKRLLDKSGLSNTKNLIINSHGASGKSKMIFEDAYNKIYRKLTRVDRNLLDEIIQAKRFIAIDKNREARGLEPVSHPNFIDKNISQKFLDKLKKEIGDEKFNDLVGRADEYFKVYKNLLQQMFDNGLISKESFDSMSDVDYQPRVFLQFVTDFNGDLESNKKTNNLDSGGLSSDQIKAMSEGDANSLVMNSEWLLTNSLLARTKAMANNNVNKRFMTEEFPKAKARFDALDPKNLQGDDKRFYKYFKELSSKVIDNPIVGFTEDGNPRYKFDKTPLNFAKMYYYVDGIQNQFFLEKELHESWNDNIGGFLSSDSKEFISYASGSALVKAIATGNNPAFPIVNTPRDFLFTVTFSDQYSNIVPKAMVQVAKDVVKSIREIRKTDSDILKKYFEYGGAMDFLSSQGKLKKDSVIGKLIDKSISPNTRDIAKNVFSKVTLSKISAYSEIMFRLGIFQRSIQNQLKDLGLKGLSEVTDKQQLDDIYNNAVASARGILDFNQGGSITKDLESVMPYINVAFQGGRVALTALEKDPVGTTSRILQVSTLASAVPIGLSLALIGSNNDDEDKSSYEVYLDAMEGISMYQKMKYMNIVTGKKNEDGQYQVLKIAKAQELSPVMSITDNIYTNFIRKIAGKEKKTAGRITQDALHTFNSNVMPFDVTSPAGFFTRTPIVKATLTYATGYDFFREEPLAMKMEKKPSPTEGMDMNSVEDFYKKLGIEYGLSPVRSKAFVESLITSPNTNPFVGILYGGADAMSSDKDLKQIGSKLFEDIYKSTGKRVVSYSSEFNRQLETNKALQDKIEKVKLNDAIQKAEFKEVAKQFVNKEISREDLNSKLMELEPIDRKRMVNKVKDKIKMQNVDGAILDIKYEQNTEAKALMIMHYYGDIFDGSQDSKEILIQMRRAKGILTPGVKYEYNKLREELKKRKRPD